jgi:hypothetical protein
MISSLATPGHDFLSMHCHSLHGAPRFAYLLYLYLGKHILYPRVHGPPIPLLLPATSIDTVQNITSPHT